MGELQLEQGREKERKGVTLLVDLSKIERGLPLRTAGFPARYMGMGSIPEPTHRTGMGRETETRKVEESMSSNHSWNQSPGRSGSLGLHGW